MFDFLKTKSKKEETQEDTILHRYNEAKEEYTKMIKNKRYIEFRKYLHDNGVSYKYYCEAIFFKNGYIKYKLYANTYEPKKLKDIITIYNGLRKKERCIIYDINKQYDIDIIFGELEGTTWDSKR